jgi:hypothetical protein
MLKRKFSFVKSKQKYFSIKHSKNIFISLSFHLPSLKRLISLFKDERDSELQIDFSELEPSFSPFSRRRS